MHAAKPLADTGGKLVGIDSADSACCPVGADAESEFHIACPHYPQSPSPVLNRLLRWGVTGTTASVGARVFGRILRQGGRSQGPECSAGCYRRITPVAIGEGDSLDDRTVAKVAVLMRRLLAAVDGTAS